MNIDDIKISIITPTFNSGSTIVETYNSISKQTHENWEWLVTDDCSSDDTINILSSICEKIQGLEYSRIRRIPVPQLLEIIHFRMFLEIL